MCWVNRTGTSPLEKLAPSLAQSVDLMEVRNAYYLLLSPLTHRYNFVCAHKDKVHYVCRFICSGRFPQENIK